MCSRSFVITMIQLLTSIITSSYCDSYESASYRSRTGNDIASKIMYRFYTNFEKCLSQTMPNQSFLSDNLQSFVNYPPKTTIGFAPKYTGNRRYLANMIGSAAFKEMLHKDEEELRKGRIKKMKYCDEVTMDQALLKDYYHREVDQSGL